jgi:hypothetical protein
MIGLRKLIIGSALVASAACWSAKASAGTISYTCDPNVAATTCTYLNTTIAGEYSSTFTNANANIYIQYGTTGLASTSSYLNFVSYTQYLAALTANGDKDGIQIAALAALNTYDTSQYGASNVNITDALGVALGLTSNLTGTTAMGAPCSFPRAGCYNAVVTVTNDPSTPLYYDNQGGAEPSDAYDYYATVQHETDEVLGTSSCISTQGPSLANECSGFEGTGTPAAADLFRYSSAGSLILNSSLSATPGAYFSYDGGVTNGANGFVYNTLSNGNDYADFLNNCPAGPLSVQDAEGCPGVDAGLSILNDGGAEINILNAVGYDVKSSSTTATPEPGTVAMLGLGLLGMAGLMLKKSV